MKQIAVGDVLLQEWFWDLLWHVCKAMHPMYCLIRLADMRIGGIDKVKYCMHQIDHMLPQSVAELLEKWKSDSCTALKLKLSCDKELDFDLPKTMGGSKTTGLEKGVHDHSLPIFTFMTGNYSSFESAMRMMMKGAMLMTVHWLQVLIPSPSGWD